MPTANAAATAFLRPAYPPHLTFALRQRAAVDQGMEARRRLLAAAGKNEPLARVAALLIAISRNNTYEGRDPTAVPEAVTSGFVADLLGVEIAALAAHLVELRERGLIDQQPSTGLRLKSIAGLETLADAG